MDLAQTARCNHNNCTLQLLVNRCSINISMTLHQICPIWTLIILKQVIQREAHQNDVAVWEQINGHDLEKSTAPNTSTLHSADESNSDPQEGLRISHRLSTTRRGRSRQEGMIAIRLFRCHRFCCSQIRDQAECWRGDLATTRQILRMATLSYTNRQGQSGFCFKMKRVWSWRQLQLLSLGNALIFHWCTWHHGRNKFGMAALSSSICFQTMSTKTIEVRQSGICLTVSLSRRARWQRNFSSWRLDSGDSW